MNLAQAVAKIAELPQILEAHGIAHGDVLGVNYDALPSNNVFIRVNLYSKSSIKNLGIYKVKNTDKSIRYEVIKDGIQFVHYEI